MADGTLVVALPNGETVAVSPDNIATLPDGSLVVVQDAGLAGARSSANSEDLSGLSPPATTQGTYLTCDESLLPAGCSTISYLDSVIEFVVSVLPVVGNVLGLIYGTVQTVWSFVPWGLVYEIYDDINRADPTPTVLSLVSPAVEAALGAAGTAIGLATWAAGVALSLVPPDPVGTVMGIVNLVIGTVLGLIPSDPVGYVSGIANGSVATVMGLLNSVSTLICGSSDPITCAIGYTDDAGSVLIMVGQTISEQSGPILDTTNGALEAAREVSDATTESGLGQQLNVLDEQYLDIATATSSCVVTNASSLTLASCSPPTPPTRQGMCQGTYYGSSSGVTGLQQHTSADVPGFPGTRISGTQTDFKFAYKVWYCSKSWTMYLNAWIRQDRYSQQDNVTGREVFSPVPGNQWTWVVQWNASGDLAGHWQGRHYLWNTPYEMGSPHDFFA
ncbi:MAG: hypothetical protein ACRD1T_08195, partial [Acidimicrobiia bacterium]